MTLSSRLVCQRPGECLQSPNGSSRRGLANAPGVADNGPSTPTPPLPTRNQPMKMSARAFRSLWVAVALLVAAPSATAWAAKKKKADDEEGDKPAALTAPEPDSMGRVHFGPPS